MFIEGEYKTEINMATFVNEKYITDIPEDRFDSFIYIPSKRLYETIKIISTFNNTINIKLNSKKLVFHIDRELFDVTYEFQTLYNYEKEKQYFVQINKDIEIPISSQNILKVLECYNLSDHIILCISEDKPVLFYYELDNRSYLKFYVLKKLDEDEDYNLNSSIYIKYFKQNLNI